MSPVMTSEQTPQQRLAHVLADIARHAKRAERAPEDIALIAVSKTKPAEEILPILAAGHRLFGENRVQKAQEKWPALKQQYPNLKLCLIGPLQSNKTREAVRLFDRIDSIDRPKIARAVSRVMAEENRNIPVLIQVNTGAEPQKSGILPEHADAFIEECREDLNLNVIGLQCIPPLDDHAAPHFALLSQIARRNGLRELSMGMSADYPAGIAMGATMIRLGTALFGARAKPQS
ncbi:MAG: YggS family pyridoxal phosphate-dependent enzyme [Pseudomonadota bacterium]